MPLGATFVYHFAVDLLNIFSQSFSSKANFRKALIFNSSLNELTLFLISKLISIMIVIEIGNSSQQIHILVRRKVDFLHFILSRHY